MEKKKKGEVALLRALQLHSKSLTTALQLLKGPASSVSERVPAIDVKNLAEQVYKEATTSGLLWTGTPTSQEAAEKLESFVNQLQGFILLCHGCTVGAGPTLLSVVEQNCKRVVESSLTLLQNALSIESQAARKDALPSLTGCVWEACEVVKKQPFENRTAIGRAIVQAGTSMKDVLRELNEIEQDEGEDEADSAIDFDVKLSSSDLEVAESVKEVITAVLALVRQVLHIVSKSQEDSDAAANLEKVLQQVVCMSREVDEIGASTMLQEMDQLKEISRKIDRFGEMVLSDAALLLKHRSVSEDLASARENLHQACTALEDKLARVNMTEILDDMKLN